MVATEFKVDRQRLYRGFTFSGHADYAEPGYDIVCAAISILSHTFMAGLETIVKLPLQIKADENSGYLDCNWVNSPDTLERVQLLVETMRLGLSGIQAQYPDHISLCEVEV
jgi:uncharacterized protein YsxB (DUF464 family)